MYNRRTWLNADNSASTGNIVAFDGDVTWRDEKMRSTFLSISDCNVSVRLHMAGDDTFTQFINKMKLLKNEIALFINYLEKTKEVTS